MKPTLPTILVNMVISAMLWHASPMHKRRGPTLFVLPGKFLEISCHLLFLPRWSPNCPMSLINFSSSDLDQGRRGDIKAVCHTGNL